MSQWFRMYNEVLDDPKVQKLPAEMFKAWVNLLCLASRNSGELPPIADIAFALRLSQSKAETAVNKLVAAGLIERTETGFRPHNWQGRQFKSDVSTERVKRFRERSKERSETKAETPPDTDTESDSSEANASAPPDLKAVVFGHGLDWLAKRTGRSRDSLRSMAGRWCKQYGAATVIDALGAAQRHGPLEPVSWIEGALKERAKPKNNSGITPLGVGG